MTLFGRIGRYINNHKGMISAVAVGTAIPLVFGISSVLQDKGVLPYKGTYKETGSVENPSPPAGGGTTGGDEPGDDDPSELETKLEEPPKDEPEETVKKEEPVKKPAEEPDKIIPGPSIDWWTIGYHRLGTREIQHEKDNFKYTNLVFSTNGVDQEITGVCEGIEFVVKRMGRKERYETFFHNRKKDTHHTEMGLSNHKYLRVIQNLLPFTPPSSYDEKKRILEEIMKELPCKDHTKELTDILEKKYGDLIAYFTIRNYGGFSFGGDEQPKPQKKTQKELFDEERNAQQSDLELGFRIMTDEGLTPSISFGVFDEEGGKKYRLKVNTEYKGVRHAHYSVLPNGDTLLEAIFYKRKEGSPKEEDQFRLEALFSKEGVFQSSKLHGPKDETKPGISKEEAEVWYKNEYVRAVQKAVVRLKAVK